MNACDCITAFCEDVTNRVDVIKSGAVNQLITVLDVQDVRVQARHVCHYHDSYKNPMVKIQAIIVSRHREKIQLLIQSQMFL
jgi:hypothetical protein